MWVRREAGGGTRGDGQDFRMVHDRLVVSEHKNNILLISLASFFLDKELGKNIGAQALMQFGFVKFVLNLK